jgi:hypothetical protein
MPTEREELDETIDRAKAGIADHLIKMGVKPDAAVRAVADEVRFGRSPSNTLLMKRGNWIAAANFERECAQHIKAGLPPEAFTEFDVEDSEDQAWAAMERRLSEASTSYSREELREQKKQAELERILNPVAPAPPTEQLLRKRSEVSSAF